MLHEFIIQNYSLLMELQKYTSDLFMRSVGKKKIYLLLALKLRTRYTRHLGNFEGEFCFFIINLFCLNKFFTLAFAYGLSQES